MEEVVYEYQNIHSQDLVYVTLTRCTDFEKLYIVCKNRIKNFIHGRKVPKSAELLKIEFAKLQKRSLITVVEDFVKFIQEKPGLSIFYCNIQSLRQHLIDLVQDEVVT